MLFKKIITYSRYFSDYLIHGDIVSILASVKYILFKKSANKNRTIKTSGGKFYCRKGTNDFQFANYYYEWGVKKYMLKNSHKYDVFIDGGSCIGEYSILMAQKKIHCIAFEPVPETYNVLRKNVLLNKFENEIDTYCLGLGKTNSRLPFMFNTVNTGASYVIKGNTQGNHTVEIRCFDDLLPDLQMQINNRILFKLDIEGFEVEALEGARQFIQTYTDITFILEDKHTGEDNIKTILNSFANFEYGIVDEYNMYAHKISNLNSYPQ